MKLRTAMTGKASDARTADGDAPVFAYIASLPQPQRGIAEQIDALAARTLPGLRRAVKWGMAYYGVEGGWCFTSGAFVGHVKVMFIRGTDLEPEPPVTPIGMGKNTRGVELASVDELEEAQLASWMNQAATMPFETAEQRRSQSRMVTRTPESATPLVDGQTETTPWAVALERLEHPAPGQNHWLATVAPDGGAPPRCGLRW
jgi:hypothetical protein